MEPVAAPKERTRLRWIAFDSIELQQVRALAAARRAGAAVVALRLDSAEMPGDRLAAWARQVRQNRLVAALLLPTTAIAGLDLAALDASGPWLIILTVRTPADAAIWPRVRDRMAGSRLPRLRWTTLGVASCWVAPFQPDLELVPAPPLAFPPECHGCGRRDRCPGPLPGHPVVPWPMAVSNQFDLVATAAPEAAIVVVDRRERRHFALPALAPAESGVVTAALAKGQLYLDRSDKARLDDFAADLALLLPVGNGTWQVAPQQPFAAEEALLLARLRALTGVVVDVGAGPVRYVHELAAAQRQGQLRYVAVEPDRAALERTVAVLPDALCLQGAGEALPLGSGVADAVLMLRSFNHLRDVPAALREVARVLRPGGTFIACDNVAFGLCRSAEQLARAHAIPVSVTPFEHYRNADAPDAAAAIEAAVPGRFCLEEVCAVAAGTSNQWFLRATLRR